MAQEMWQPVPFDGGYRRREEEAWYLNELEREEAERQQAEQRAAARARTLLLLLSRR